MLNQHQLQRINYMIQARDFTYNGIPLHEMITFILGIISSTTQAVEKNFDYLTQSGKLAELDKGGRTIVAQATPSDICMITLVQQQIGPYLIKSE